jgi:hypothetical protein
MWPTGRLIFDHFYQSNSQLVETSLLKVLENIFFPKLSGVDGMITFFAIFDNFRRKKWRFSQTPMI